MPDLTATETLLRDATWLRRLSRELAHDPAFAEDLYQETVFAALRSPNPGGRGWLARVARNLAVTFLRRDKCRARAERVAATRPYDDTADGLPTSDHVAEGELLKVAVTTVMSLDEPYRSTLLLRFMKGLSTHEVAARMRVPPETVRTRQKRGLERVRKRIHQVLGHDTKNSSRSTAALLSPSWIGPTISISQTITRSYVLMKAKPLGVGVAILFLVAGASWFVSQGLAAEEIPANSVAELKAKSPASPPEGKPPIEPRVRDKTRERIAEENVSDGEPAVQPATGELLVRATWADGSPATGISMRLWKTPRFLDSVRTDADGTALWSDLMEGGYAIYVDRVWGAKFAMVKPGHRTTHEESLPEGVKVRGVVVDGIGKRVSGAEIFGLFLLNQQQHVQRIAQSNAEGEFSLRAMSEGIAIGARLPASGISDVLRVRDRPRERDGSVKLRLVLPGRPATLRGIVVDAANEPVVGAQVQIGAITGRGGHDPGPQPPPPIYQLTDSEGRFSTAALRAGTHPVHVIADGHAPWRGKAHCVAAGSTEIRCELTAGATLIGRVLGADRQPRATIGIRNLEHPFRPMQTSTNAEGRFTIRNLPPGPFRVTLVGRRKVTLEIPAEGTIRHDFLLAPDPKMLRGTLVDERGAPLANWMIGPDNWVANPTNHVGQFKIRATPFLVQRQPPFLQIPIARFEPGNETYRIMDKWLHSAIVRGRVLGADNKPLRGAKVFASRSIQLGGIAVAESDGTGHFKTPKLPPGTYRLSVSHPTHKHHAWDQIILSQDEIEELPHVTLQPR